MVELGSAESIPAVLRRHAENTPDRAAHAFVTDLDEAGGVAWLSHAELDRRARAVAAQLSAHAAPGDRMLLLHPAGPDFLIALLGCLHAGLIAVPSPLPGRYAHQRRRVRLIAADADVTAVLTDRATRAEVVEWAAEQGLPDIAVLTPDPEADPGDWQPPPLSRDTVAVLQYTSGSTGNPKGVVIDHGNILSNAATIIAVTGIRPGTVIGGWLPHFHDMGLMGLLLPPLLAGATTVLSSPVSFLKRPLSWLRMIDRYGVEITAAPDFAYDLCVAKVTDAELATLDLSRWRVAINGSEPVRAAVLTRFRQRFAAAGLRPEVLTPSFGMAEATLFVSGDPATPFVVRRVDTDRLARHRFEPAPDGGPGRDVVACGAPAGVEVRIVDPGSGDPLPDGAVGEIWLRGPSIGRGYWGRAANTAGFGAVTSIGDAGYLRTGDLGTLYEGQLYVTGRRKDMLVLRGRNYYPQDIEHELRAHHPELAGRVGACFAVRSRDGAGGGEEVLVVTHEVRGISDPDRLRTLAGAMRLTVAREFGVPSAAVLLLRPGAVARTTSGKIQRSAMRELFETGALEPVGGEVDDRLVATAALGAAR
ncbi:fatty acyl-AMP ligase [Amorphoplanes nipponensis]|uniref:Polyketide synthase n=1 Tax=Actinoplanes nipponensis TaxID=135950 RepID=A0A919JRF6_9ACTN|nr:fatty acyl-AMP ligase [Actinoplanes nipponensis]GIE54413.1 polyketide synthase [Actinoplanes nipponensis]